MAKARLIPPLAVLSWARDGIRPKPGLQKGKHGYKTPYPGLSGLGGGSANISLQAALLDLAARVPRVPQALEHLEALEYLEARAEDELRNGLGGGEQLSPAYEHITFWALVWWTAWKLGHERLCRLAGAWVERHMLVSCLLGRLEHGVLAIYAPGMRADKGADRVIEEAVVAHLLGIGHPLSTNMDLPERKWWWGGILLEAVRSAGGVERVAHRVRHGCLRLLSTKDEANRVFTWAQIAFHVPVKVEVYSPQEWIAWIEAGGQHWSGHGQDPLMAWGGVLGGRPTAGLPYEPGENPPEGGWGAEVRRNRGGLHAIWTRGGEAVANRVQPLPTPLHSLTLHRPTADPLADLPPVPEGRPEGGERPEPPPTPEPKEPEEEEPMPEEEVPLPRVAQDPDLRRVQQALEEIRDGHPHPDDRRWAHRSLVKLNKLGAWE